jgi:hypothetical protein
VALRFGGYCRCSSFSSYRYLDCILPCSNGRDLRPLTGAMTQDLYQCYLRWQPVGLLAMCEWNNCFGGRSFMARQDAVLVATDVAARGIDVKGVAAVVHYQIPKSTDTYVHRRGKCRLFIAKQARHSCEISWQRDTMFS